MCSNVAAGREPTAAVQEVCLGLLTEGHFRPFKASRSKLPHARFQVSLQPLGSDVAVLDFGTERYLGLLCKEISESLSVFLDDGNLRLESFATNGSIDQGEDPSEKRGIEILVYSSSHLASDFGKRLSVKGLYLQHPFVHPQITVPYRNPQYLLPKGTPFPDLQSIADSLHDKDEDCERAQGTNRGSSVHPTLFDTAQGPSSWQGLKQSDTLRTALKEHQLKALAMMAEKERGLQETTDFPAMWKYMGRSSGMKSTYRNVINGACKESPRVSLGGLLADDMGLGKTLTTIALIAGTMEDARTICQEASQSQETDLDSFGLSLTLVVAPKTTMASWERQFGEHMKPNTIKVCHYYGRDRRKRLSPRPQDFDVILTTYGIIAKEHSQMSQEAKEASPLFSTQWFRVVFDEAHFLRNTTTRLFAAATAIRAERVWCLTGTPIQNSIVDLGALVQLLRASPFDNPGTFAYEIIQPIKNNEKSAFTKLRRLIACLSLRRTKDILNLPPRHLYVEQIDLTGYEKDLYDAMSSRLLERIDGYLQAGVNKRSLAHVMEQILRLRQICNHGKDLLPSATLEMLGDDAYDFYNSRLKDSIDCEVCSHKVQDLMSDLECMHLVCIKCSQKLQQEQPEAEAACPVCNGFASQDSSASMTLPALHNPDSRETQPSSKVSRLIRNLQMLEYGGTPSAPTKSVVFSEWTSMLDLVELSLAKLSFNFARIDGQMKAKAWKDNLKRFSTDDKCTVLLASIRNAGTGIDLLVANTVHLLEPQWNPMVEEQALDRVHRLGQKRPVQMYRYVVNDSIEQYVQQKQKHKLELISASLDAHRDERRLTLEEKLRDIKDFIHKHPALEVTHMASTTLSNIAVESM